MVEMKTAIVTGASGNLGSEVIKKFLQQEYKVGGTTVPGHPVEFDVPGHHFEKIEVDLLNENDSRQAVESFAERNGSIDVAVLTVGGFATGRIADTPATDIMQQYKLNFETAYNIARPVFIQMMKQNGGRIFLIGSKPGLDARNSKGMVAYGLGKSLIFWLAELINDEGKANNVVASVIVPGTIDTPQNRKSMPDADFNRWVKAEDIARIIYLYSTDEARIIREPVIKTYGDS